MRILWRQRTVLSRRPHRVIYWTGIKCGRRFVGYVDRLQELPDGHPSPDEMYGALVAVWDECEDFVVFEPVRERVKQVLGIREFTAAFDGQENTDE